MHFFIDQSKIDSQPSAYGPVPGAEATQYRITSTFNLTSNAKAFACQSGSILVLPSADTLLVNVILKPDSGLQVPFPAIKYYIYRGLLKDSFISGTNITPENDATNSEFITALWRQVAKYRVIKSLPDPTQAAIGYLPALSDDVNIEDLFNNDPSLGLPEAITLNKVIEGDWLGNFGTIAGLEIVTDIDLTGVMVGYCKKTEHVLDVAGIPSGTDAQKLTLRMEKEKILNYIDPAACWGMHYSKGMYVYDPSLTSEKKKVSQDEIYFEVMNKYLTKNRVYLDIRSEKGYSYNFYTNYGATGSKNLHFKIPDDATFRELEFGERWPIFMYHFGRFEFPNTSKFIIQLRVDDNEKPLLFFQDPDLINSSPNPSFIQPEKLLNGTNTDWTNEITLRFKNIEDPDITNQPPIPVEPGDPGMPSTGTRVYIGNHLRIQYFRLSLNDSVKPLVFGGRYEADRAFGSIDQLPINTSSPFFYVTTNKRSAVFSRDYAYVAATGIFYDQQQAVLYGKSLYTFKNSGDVWPRIRTNKPNKELVASPLFPRDILFEKWRVRNVATTQDMDTIKIAGCTDILHSNHFKEDNFFLCLSRAELDTLKAIAGYHAAYPRHLVFKSIPVPSGTSYQSFSLEVTGYRPDGSGIVTQAPATPVVVYSLDNQLYFSNAFLQQSTMDYTPPDPGIVKDFLLSSFLLVNNTSPVHIEDEDLYRFVDASDELVAAPAVIYLRRNMFYPTIGTANPLPAGTTFPLVMIVHGNGHDRDDYDGLARHLAKNGFIVAVVDCLTQNRYKRTTTNDQKHYFQKGRDIFYLDGPTGIVHKKQDNSIVSRGATLGLDDMIFMKDAHGMGALGREYVIAKHLENLRSDVLKDHIQFDNIGLIGHSRGGEAVVKVAGETIPQPGNPNNRIPLLPAGCVIRSIVSLAPTDMYKQADLAQHIPCFFLYGSMDGDVKGEHRGDGRNSAFSLYDRAINESEKAMAYVYGATHNGFITGNTVTELTALGYTNGVLPARTVVLDAEKQKHIALAYMNAFLRMTLRGERVWQPMFTGEQKPLSMNLANHRGLFFQYKAPFGQYMLIDDFDTDSSPRNDWKVSSIGGDVNGNLDSISEGTLTVDNSPHDTRGLRITWKSHNKLDYLFENAPIDVSAFKFVSFRIAKRVGSTLPLNLLRLELMDNDKKIGYANMNNGHLFDDFVIPDADMRIENAEDFTKSAMITVRVPLQKFIDFGVKPQFIKRMSFQFPEGTGKVLMDNIEFTN